MLPTDSKARKGIPLWDFYRGYFPRAMVALTRLSKRANDKHNPGEPMHWSRAKSADHENCIMRHMLEAGEGRIDPETGELYEVAIAWRALAKAELALEKAAADAANRTVSPWWKVAEAPAETDLDHAAERLVTAAMEGEAI